MGTGGRVAVIGSTNLDFTVSVPRLPQVGETVSGGELRTSAGGKGANQAVAARRLGAEVRFLTLLGEDPMGDRLARVLAEAGLDPSLVLRSREAATGVALIAVDAAGRNQIVVAPGANHRLDPGRLAAHPGVLDGAAVLLLQLETPIETVRGALAEARRRGIVTILNPAPARVLPLPPDLLRWVDFLTPNQGEAGLLTGREVGDLDAAAAAGAWLLEAGVGCVVVTLGDAGALCLRPGERRHVAGFQVTPVDTVGAGDAFNGALAAALAAGASTEDALVVANAAGALACTRPGAVDALPTRDEVAALLHQARRWPLTPW